MSVMTTPEISIGMPAYNAERTIAHAIECLLAQTHADFELIISDNASTDGTFEIVWQYSRRDSRIVALRQPFNIGANGNYSAVFRHARGTWFKWASSNDWCAPTFLGACLAALAGRDDAVLAAPRTRLFEGHITRAQDYAHDIALLDAAPSQRLQMLISTLRLNNAMNGLIRTAALRQTRLVEPYYGADVVLMGHLALLGKMLRLNEYLFYRRMEAATATARQDANAVRRHHYPTLSRRILFQGLKRTGGWLRVAATADVSVVERLRALKHVMRMIYWDRAEFTADLRGALLYALRRPASHSEDARCDLG